MSDEEAKVTDNLREKIRSKMDVAKFFTGFITLLIGFLLNGGKLATSFSKSGIVLLIASLSFCVAAMFIYDHLLWPKKYWTDSSGVEISENRFHKRLRKAMLISWLCLFVPAVVCFVIGLLLVLVQEFGMVGRSDYPEDIKNLVWVISLGAAVGIPILVCCVIWPRTNRGNEASATDSSG